MSDFKAKKHKIRFPLGLRWGSLQRYADPLAVFNGPTCKGKAEEEGEEGKGEREGEGKREGSEGRRRERRGGASSPPQYFGGSTAPSLGALWTVYRRWTARGPRWHLEDCAMQTTETGSESASEQLLSHKNRSSCKQRRSERTSERCRVCCQGRGLV